MAVKASFYVREITDYAHAQNTKVTLAASVQGEGNKDWSKYTPSGEIVIQVTNEAAVAWFKDHMGKDVSVTFDERE